MRISLISLIFIAACSSDANHIGNPLLLPVNALTSMTENAIYTQRRGQVELAVKSTFDQIIPEINSGGGPAISTAMEAAGIPLAERPARLTQLRGDIGLYDANPGALVTALMVYGSN
ncbi:hypothetical protein FHS72_003474 [Loktanella ponticola]|uniref:Uncharacterized protein n=1 Tax=Yoonia ponticola TaxID=1524255 RepID=A0A7W9BNM1_9RHOB|nr:hypothetical protein [Yoonia ponticola]MBB5723829.1 hypothetical protein [Yoonia ponticola]